jgi:hypothetical protein
LQVSIVEGPIDDRQRARTGLVELRASGRVAFGGFFDQDIGLAVVRLSDLEESLGVLAGAVGWTAGRLIVRTWSQTL